MNRSLPYLYVFNAAVLATHQVDSGVQHEWQLFGLPGDEQSFVLSSLLLFLAVFFGMLKLQSGSTVGLALSLVLSFTGVFSFLVHQHHILQGAPEYTTALSRALLWGGLLISCAQGWLTLRAMFRQLRPEGESKPV